MSESRGVLATCNWLANYTIDNYLRIHICSSSTVCAHWLLIKKEDQRLAMFHSGNKRYTMSYRWQYLVLFLSDFIEQLI